MKIYVSITETLSKVICVEAENDKEAVNIAENAYFKEQIVLNQNGHFGYAIDVVDDQEHFREMEEDGECYQHIK